MVSLFTDSDAELEGYVCWIYLCMEETYAIYLFSHTQILLINEYLYKSFNFPIQFKLINRSKVHTI